jgi:hypothetical protein
MDLVVGEHQEGIGLHGIDHQVSDHGRIEDLEVDRLLIGIWSWNVICSLMFVATGPGHRQLTPMPFGRR